MPIQSGNYINATVSVNPFGVTSYAFSDSFDMLISLGSTNATPIVLSGTSSADRILLQNSGGNVIFGDNGNDEFVMSSNQTSLSDNVIIGGKGFNVITIGTSGSTVDLTATGNATNQSSGIEAVVGKFGFTG